MLPLPMLLLSLSLPARADWLKALPDAVSASKASARPILVDFQAPWCYSCYYMEQRVLSKPAFAEKAKGLVLVKLDVDTDEGSALKEKFRVTFMPTYVVLASGGDRELGRIIGEQAEADFLDKLSALTGGRGTDDAAVQARQRKIKSGDLAELERELDAPADCRTPYAVEYGEAFVAKLPAARRAKMLRKERASLESLASSRLFASAENRCADFRSGVEALAGVDEALGDNAARDAALDRAIAQLEADQTSVGVDRNRDDNLRLFLDMRGDETKLAAHYEALIKSYPNDYVYAYRLAKHLVQRGRASEALPWLDKADRRAYGANRLMVTEVRARALAALGRRAEGQALLERDLQASRGRFPDEEPLLRKALDELSARARR